MSAKKRPTAPAAEQPFVVRRSGIQGKGGFATRRIRKGERIIEYVGERINWKEADRRYPDDATNRHHTFLFAVTTRTVIDAMVHGNDARFINHSCDPNCEAVDEEGRIFIEAIRTIQPGEELAYDYAYDRDDVEAEYAERADEIYACRCGSKKCRGTILAPPEKKKPMKRQKRATGRKRAA